MIGTQKLNALEAMAYTASPDLLVFPPVHPEYEKADFGPIIPVEIPEDIEARISAYRGAINDGTMTVNEARQREGLPPIGFAPGHVVVAPSPPPVEISPGVFQVTYCFDVLPDADAPLIVEPPHAAP